MTINVVGDIVYLGGVQVAVIDRSAPHSYVVKFVELLLQRLAQRLD